LAARCLSRTAECPSDPPGGGGVDGQAARHGPVLPHRRQRPCYRLTVAQRRSRQCLRSVHRGWPQNELDSILSNTVAGDENLLPIWRDFTNDAVHAQSQSLGDKLARAPEFTSTRSPKKSSAGFGRPCCTASDLARSARGRAVLRISCLTGRSATLAPTRCRAPVLVPQDPYRRASTCSDERSLRASASDGQV